MPFYKFVGLFVVSLNFLINNITLVPSGSQAELQHSLQASESSAAAAQEALSEKEMELRELKSQKAAEQGLISKEDHEALRLSLQAEINAATARFNDLTRKHEKTCTEVCVCVTSSALSCHLKPHCVLHKVSRVP